MNGTPSTHRNTSADWLGLVLAQAVWWLAVLDQTLAAGLLLLAQLALMWSRWRWQARHWLPVALIAASGVLVDGVIAATGVIRFRDPLLFGVPLWLLVLWASFALTVPILLQWLARPWLRAVVFVGAGPLAYVGGAALGAAKIVQPLPYALLLLTAWLLMPWLWSSFFRQS